MDSYIQILCRLQKSMQKVPPPSLPCTKKSPTNPPAPPPQGRVKGDFLVQGSDGGGTFCIHFWNLHKIYLDMRIH
jgi:hypothetical protein